MKTEKKVYTIKLTETEFFIIVNSLYDTLNKEIELKPKHKRIIKLITKLDNEYFK